MKDLLLFTTILCTLSGALSASEVHSNAEEAPAGNADTVEVQDTASSEPNDTVTGYMHTNNYAIGAAAGATSGIGLSYRYWPGDAGIQITFVPILNEQGTFISLGIAQLYMINRHQSVSLYLNTGAHLLHDNGNTQINVGIGPVMDVHFDEVFGISFMFGIGLYNITDVPTANPTGEIAFFYWF